MKHFREDCNALQEALVARGKDYVRYFPQCVSNIDGGIITLKMVSIYMRAFNFKTIYGISNYMRNIYCYVLMHDYQRYCD